MSDGTQSSIEPEDENQIDDILNDFFREFDTTLNSALNKIGGIYITQILSEPNEARKTNSLLALLADRSISYVNEFRLAGMVSSKSSFQEMKSSSSETSAAVTASKNGEDIPADDAPVPSQDIPADDAPSKKANKGERKGRKVDTPSIDYDRFVLQAVSEVASDDFVPFEVIAEKAKEIMERENALHPDDYEIIPSRNIPRWRTQMSTVRDRLSKKGMIITDEKKRRWKKVSSFSS